MPAHLPSTPAPRANDIDRDAETIAVAGRLARKGAYAAAVDAAASKAFAVFSPRNAFERPIAEVTARAVADAVHKGWLAPEPGGARLHLTEAGLRAVRRARSQQGATTARRPTGGRSAGTVSAVSAASRPQPAEGPLAWLRRRKDRSGQPLITDAQFAAGERLAAAFHAAHLQARVTADWSAAASGRRMRRGAPGAGVEMSDHVVAARERFHAALVAVGPELAGVLVDVCCHDAGLEAVERVRGWPQRSAKVVLDMGLTALARHFGLIAPERPVHVRSRRWSEEGFSPSLEAWR